MPSFPVAAFGAFCFGLVVGWVTYRTLRRTGSNAAVSDIAAVIGAVGGTTVTGLFKDKQFGWYAIGFAAGFFSFYAVTIVVSHIHTDGKPVEEWRIGRDE